MALFPNHPELETARFRLRAAEEDEIPSLLELAWRRGQPAETLEEARANFAYVAEEVSAGRCLHWLIEEKSTGEAIGSVGYYRSFAGGLGEVGYVMRAAHRGRGVMTEVLPEVLRYGWEERGLSRIIAVTRPGNLPSVALLVRAGFVAESDREDGYRVFALVRP